MAKTGRRVEIKSSIQANRKITSFNRKVKTHTDDLPPGELEDLISRGAMLPEAYEIKDTESDPIAILGDRVKGRPDLARACIQFLNSEITRPEYAKLSRELTEARLDKEREQRRLRQERYRARIRAKDAQP